MRHHLGMVVPVWFPEDLDGAEISILLEETLKDCPRFLTWTNVYVVIDGAPWALPLVENLQNRLADSLGHSFNVIEMSENGGKGLTVAGGFEALLENNDISHFCIRDDDNDHSIWDLPHLMRAQLQIESAVDTELVMMVGARPDISRPMGFWRGEFELLHNQLVWESIKFVLASQKRTINTQWISGTSEIPDLESGYKIYSRSAAELFVQSIRHAAEQYATMRMGHFGVETVPAIEVLLKGGVIGQSRRAAYDRQPVSTFAAGTKLPQMYANQASYVFSRLQIPPEIAAQFIRNAVPRSQLSRLPEGLALVREYIELVAASTGILDFEKDIPVPRFI